MKKSTVKNVGISLCAIAVVLMFLPIVILNMNGAQIGAFIFMPVFLLVAMGIAYVLGKKSRDSMGEIIKKNTVLCWQMEANDNLRKRAVRGVVIKNASVILLCVIALCVILLLNSADWRVVLCFSGAMLTLCAAFALDGAVKVIDICGGLDGFILGHNFMCISGKFILLDGMKNAIYKTELKGEVFTIGLILSGRQTELPLTVPCESVKSVEAFLEDLQRHFDASNAENRGDQTVEPLDEIEFADEDQPSDEIESADEDQPAGDAKA